MKEALIIFIVGIILGTNYAHGSTASGRSVDQLIAQAERLVHSTDTGIPLGWDNMNLEANLENVRDALAQTLPHAPSSKRPVIEKEIKRIEATLHLVVSDE